MYSVKICVRKNVTNLIDDNAYTMTHIGSISIRHNYIENTFWIKIGNLNRRVCEMIYII